MLKRYFDPLRNAYRVNPVFLLAHSLCNGLAIALVIKLMVLDLVYGSCALIGLIFFNLSILASVLKQARKLETRAARRRA